MIIPELSHQTVLITGAANGLGRALAKAFGDAGVTLALVDVDEQGLAETASTLPKASTYVADLSNIESTRRMIDAVRANHATVHTLVHNAGYLVPQPFADMSDEVWDRTFNVGIQAARRCSPKPSGLVGWKQAGQQSTSLPARESKASTERPLTARPNMRSRDW